MKLYFRMEEDRMRRGGRGGGGSSSKWKHIKDVLTLKCGCSAWHGSSHALMEEEEEEEAAEERYFSSSEYPNHRQIEVADNLGVALARERRFRETNNRKSLMRLLEEKDKEEKENKCKEKVKERVVDNGYGARATVEDMEEMGGCCVCMERMKGAAFIPCGHTFCRPCARELWVDRGACPVCNRFVLDILHIF